VGLFPQIVPACFGHLNAVVFGSGFDVGKGLFAFVVGDVFDLIEPGDGVADVGGVIQGFLAFVGEGIGGRWEFVALLCVESFVVFVMLPCCFHRDSNPGRKIAGVRALFGWMRFAVQML